ncbi:PEP-CTERM sorting domain-containing protein [Oceaniferula spumae]
MSLPLAAALFSITTSTHATIVLIDFGAPAPGGTPPPAGIDGNGNIWNEGSTTTLSNLVAADGSGATTWDYAITGFSGPGSVRSNFSGNGANGPAGPAPFDQEFAHIDGIFSQGTSAPATITFTDLTPSTTYFFSAIGGRRNASDVVNGENGLITVTTGISNSATYGLANDGTQADFSITSNGSGMIAFNFRSTDNAGGGGSSSNAANINALRISTVPEPSSTALLGLAGLPLILRRRR